MKDDTWKNIDDSVYSPTTIKLGILHALQSASHRNKSMHNLDVFIDNLIYERKQIILDENGVSLSKSMYIPYEILSKEILSAMTLLVDSVATRSFFTQDENVHTCFECPLPGDNNTLGVVNVLCGFLLAINECGHLNDSNRPYNSNLLSVFDVILKSILFKHSIDFSVVMENCVRYHILSTNVENVVIILLCLHKKKSASCCETNVFSFRYGYTDYSESHPQEF